jgi:glutamate N-acetyltransferase/amino-acid N-acetyltransferase
MAVNLEAPSSLLPVAGVRLGSANAGIKQTVRDDLVVITLPEGATVGAVFTQSRFRAAPVIVAAESLGRAAPRALVINSGNANAATGGPGIEDARAVCREVSRRLNLEPDSVLPFSTGVIGARLPVEAINSAIARLARDCDGDDLLRAARAIMTTDTVAKGVSRTVELDGTTVTITGIAKGAGMIKPDMATMLAYVMTDACIERDVLQRLTVRAADASFNRITVDGDTSTNDSFVVCATQLAGHRPITGESHPLYAPLAEAVVDVSRQLAQAIVRDAEGATKFVTVRVCGGRDVAECLKVAYTVAESPLIKTALFAGDPNWGRFCMAIGRAGIDDLDPALVDLDFDDVTVARGGLLAPGYEEADAARVLARPEFTVTIGLGRGRAEETVWTCDFSYDNVKINAEYRS